jgi:hypothetical protein
MRRSDQNSAAVILVGYFSYQTRDGETRGILFESSEVSCSYGTCYPEFLYDSFFPSNILCTQSVLSFFALRYIFSVFSHFCATPRVHICYSCKLISRWTGLAPWTDCLCPLEPCVLFTGVLKAPGTCSLQTLCSLQDPHGKLGGWSSGMS